MARERLILALGQEPTAYDPRNLEILVRLRRKSVQDLGEELPLVTAHGVGYAFLADIRVVQLKAPPIRLIPGSHRRCTELGPSGRRAGGRG